jgi:phospholipase/carboxylesterase
MSVGLFTDIFEYEFIPSQKPSKKLMIVLHGKGDSAKPFKYFDQELNIKDLNFLLLNAPKKFLGGYSWYNEPPKMKNHIIEIREKIFILLDVLRHQGWDSNNIYLFGFSQGALISADIALNYPKRFAGVIGVSGYFYFFPRWQSQLNEENMKTPWLLIHGTDDEILPIKITEFGMNKLRLSGFKVDWKVLKKKHVLNENEYPIIKKWISKS